MNDLVFYDAAVPPASPPEADGAAVYIGGDTPHVWTRADVEGTKVRYLLPVFVRSNPAQASAAVDAGAALAALHNLGVPKGSLVSWDTETAADPAYMRVVYDLIVGAGYKLMDYGSQDDLFANELPVGGYYWGADWTGTAHIDQGDAGTQYENLAAAGIDLSVFKPGLPFWDTKIGVSRETWQEKMMQQLPTIGQGASGPMVKTVQALCNARDAGPGDILLIDGTFGELTVNAVKAIQRGHGITADGVVGPQTWPALLGV